MASKRRLCGALALWMGLFLAWLPATGRAQTSADPPFLAVLDLAELTPGELDTLLKDVPESLILPGGDRPVLHLGGESLRTARWELFRAVNLERAPDQSICGQPFPVDAEFESLEEAWLFADVDAGRASLQRLFSAAVCGDVVLGPKDLGKLFYHQGLLEVFTGQDGVSNMFAAISIYPALAFPVNQNSEVKRTFRAAQERMIQSPNVRVNVSQAAMEGAELWVDGALPEDSELVLTGGPHFVQVRSHDGTTLMGRLVGLSPTGDDRPVLWPTSDFLPPEPSTTIARLEREFATRATGPISEALSNAIRAERGSIYYVLLVSDPVTVPGLTVRWMGPSGYVQDRSVPRDEAEVAPPRSRGRGPSGGGRGAPSKETSLGRSGVVQSNPGATARRIGLATGALGILSAAGAGYLYYYLDATTFTSFDEAEPYRLLLLSAEGLALGSLTAATTSTVIGRTRRTRARIGLTLGPGSDGSLDSVSLAWGGTW